MADACETDTKLGGIVRLVGTASAIHSEGRKAERNVELDAVAGGFMSRRSTRSASSDLGQSLLEVALWASAALAVIGVGVFAVRWAQARSGHELSAAEQSYVQVVATQQAEAFIRAVAAQQDAQASAPPPTRSVPPAAEHVVDAPPSQQPRQSPVEQTPPRTVEPPPSQPAARPAIPTQTPIISPTQPPPPPTPDSSAQLATCRAKVQQEEATLSSLGSAHQSGSTTALSDFFKRLREVTPGVINECAGVMNNGTQDASAVHSLCVKYNPTPEYKETYKPQICYSLQPPPGESWPFQ